MNEKKLPLPIEVPEEIGMIPKLRGEEFEFSYPFPDIVTSSSFGGKLIDEDGSSKDKYSEIRVDVPEKGFFISPERLAARSLIAAFRRTREGNDFSSLVMENVQAEEDKLLDELLSQGSGTSRTQESSAPAQRFRAGRIRESSPLRALLSTVRSDPGTWGRVAGFMDRSRKGAYIEASDRGRNRVLSPLFAGIYTADPNRLELALDEAVKADGEQLRSGDYWPTVVVGSGPSASVFISARREAKPDEAVLAVDEGRHLGGQFAMAERPLFRLNSRNRPTRADAKDPLPGDKGNLNDLSPGVIEVSDLDSTIYPTQNVLGTASALNTYLNSSLVAAETKIIGVQPNRDAIRTGRYLLVMERGGKITEVTTDRLVVGSGLGREKYAFNDSDTTALIEQERAADKPRVLTYDDFLKAAGDRTRQFPLADYKDKRVAVIGDGDSAKTVIETLLGLQVQAGDSVAQADQVDKIVWVGQSATDKEDLCNQLRARYGLIALNAPRDNSSFESRIEIVPPKARSISESDGKLKITAEAGGDTNADMVILAKGYESEIDTVLRGVAKPTGIDGRDINGNPTAQQQLAKALLPGSFITLDGKGSSKSTVEILPAAAGRQTLRFCLDGRRIDRTYAGDAFQTELQKVLASGKVVSIEAISKGERGSGTGQAAIAEKSGGVAGLRDFIRREQAAGNTIYGFTSSGLSDELPEGFADSRVTATIRTQRGYNDFFSANTGFNTGQSEVSVNNYLSTTYINDIGVVLSLPSGKTLDDQSRSRLVAQLERGDTSRLEELIRPGFGIVFENNVDPPNTIVVVGAENGTVQYLDKLRIRRGILNSPVVTTSEQDFTRFLRLQFTRNEAGRYPSAFRVVNDDAPRRTSTPAAIEAPVSAAEVASGDASPRGRYVRNKEEGPNAVYGFVQNEQRRGNQVYTLDYDGFMRQVTLENGSLQVTSQDFEDLDFFSGRQSITTETGLNEDLISDIVNTDYEIVFSLPAGEVLGDEGTETYKNLFKQRAVGLLDDRLQPGFAIRLEDDDQNNVLCIIRRDGNIIEYIDKDDIGNSYDEYGSLQTTVPEFVSRVGRRFDYRADDYRVAIRVPKGVPQKNEEKPAAAVTTAQPSPVLAEEPKKPETDKPIAVAPSKLNLTEQSIGTGDEQTAVAKAVFGEDIYIIGPAARLPYDRRERQRLNEIGLSENAEAIFRYAPRGRQLAEILPSRVTKPRGGFPPFQVPVPVFAESKAKYKVDRTFTSENIAAADAAVRLPYDADPNELSAYALAAALQGRVGSVEKPYTVTLSADRKDGGLTFETTANGLNEASIRALASAVLTSDLFLSSFNKLAAATPRGYRRQISFDLTPNGVNPYSIAIQNVRNKTAGGRVSYPKK